MHDVLKNANAHPSWHTTKLPIFTTLIALPRDPEYFHWVYSPRYWNEKEALYNNVTGTTKFVRDYEHLANFMYIVENEETDAITTDYYGQLGYYIRDYSKIHYFINVPNNLWYNLGADISKVTKKEDIPTVVNEKDSESAYQKVFDYDNGVLRTTMIANFRLTDTHGGSHILYVHPKIHSYIYDYNGRHTNHHSHLFSNDITNFSQYCTYHTPKFNPDYFARRVHEIPINDTARNY